ncbi:hypothetical protein [Novosphingobium clariflavum]|uniref:Secreted protein n=1 Tax=Novosphingobium clariflavum TaxID=2029884 RepID=A0ABV6S7C9_9SPHN|nr:MULTISPECIES: hypothetical protein [Novosphingobium]
MKKSISALALAMLSVATPATAQNTLLPAGKWFCRANTLIMCNDDGTCTKRPSNVSDIVDFTNDSITSLNVGGKVSPLKHVDALGDTIVFSNWVGNVFTIEEVKNNGIVNYRFKVILFLGDPLIHVGTCNPM